MKKILQKLVDLQIISAEQAQTFDESEVVRAIEGMNQAFLIVQKNNDILQAENKAAGKSKASSYIPDIVQAQRDAVEEVRAKNPGLSFVQCFNKAKQSHPTAFETDTITIGGTA